MSLCDGQFVLSRLETIHFLCCSDLRVIRNLFGFLNYKHRNGPFLTPCCKITLNKFLPVSMSVGLKHWDGKGK